jgi:hypothetical protein
MAKADIFDKNGLTVGRKFVKIVRMLDKIDNTKSQGVI